MWAVFCLPMTAALAVPAEWHAAEVVCECEDFDRGNVRRDGGSYGPEGWCILDAGELPNWAEYDFRTKGGWYQLLVRYAARDSRPVRLCLDDSQTGTICVDTTGSWSEETAQWAPSALVHLKAGEHVLRTERRGPMPHLDQWALTAVDISVSRRLHPDGTWSVRVVGDNARQVLGTEADGRGLAPGERVVAGTELWILLDNPPRKAGPIVMPNLNVLGRLARATKWIHNALDYCSDLADVIGEQHAAQVSKELKAALDTLSLYSQEAEKLLGGQPQEGQGSAEAGESVGTGLRETLSGIETVEKEVRGAVYAALGAAGRGHEALRKRGYYTIVGNQLVATAWSSDFDDESGRPTGPRKYAPGIVSVSYYPPAKLTYFSVSPPVAEVELRRGERPLKLILDEQSSDWYPHALHTEYTVEGGGRLIQDLCVADDVAVARIQMDGIPADTEACVVGTPLAGNMVDTLEASNNAVALMLEARGQRLAQAVAVSRPVKTLAEGEQYSLELGLLANSDERLVIAATVRETIADAREVVEHTVAHASDAFAESEARWAQFFGQVLPRFSSSDVRLMDLHYTIGYVLWADRYEMPEGGQWKHPYVVPSKWTWRGIWPEDLSHCLTGLRWLNDPATAYGCLRVIRDHFFRPDANEKAKVHAYGLLTMAAWQVYERHGEIEFVRELYPTLRQMNDFIAEKCDYDHDGLPAMWDSFHLGWDSSRRYDCNGNLVERRHFNEPVEPIDCAVYFWQQSSLLARMAEELNEPDDARKLHDRANKTWQAIDERMWDQDTGFFYDVFAETGEKCPIKSCAGMFPLIGGELDGRRRDSLVRHLKEPTEFWASYPVPCLAMDEPNFGGAWSGASCLRNNWLIYRGLHDCEMNEVAAELAARTFALLALTPLDAMNEGYYYDPTSGQARSEHLGNLFSTPLAGALDMIVTGVCGLRPTATGEWQVRPLEQLQPEWWVLSGLDVSGRAATVTGGRSEVGRLRYE